MKRIFTLILSFISISAFSQIYYNFDTPTPTTNSYSNITADSLSAVNNNGTTTIRTASSVSNNTGASGSYNAGAAVKLGGIDTATSFYFQTTLTPTAGNSVSLSGISFDSRSTSTGPQNISVRTSVDNFRADAATFAVAANATWTLQSSNIAVTGIAGAAVVVRLYAFNGSGTPAAGTANWRIDDLTFNPSATLPLTLTSFTGALNGRSVQLKWTSATESNVKGYSVEKSVNGGAYSEIVFVSAKNSSVENSYSYDDADVKAGTNAYRLKMVDNDGAAKYSAVVTINNTTAISARVYPNPAVNTLIVNHSKANAGAILRVLSLEGKLLMINAVQTGAIQTSVSINELNRGNYILIYENNGEKTVTQFSKQ